jgi:hypothetical protein
MVFIRPKILNDGITTAIETDAKYNYIRNELMRGSRPKTEVLPLIPFSPSPTLPPLPPPLPPREEPAKPAAPDDASQTPPADEPANTPKQ